MATSCDSEFLFLDNILIENVDVLPRRLDQCRIGRNDEGIQMCPCEKLKKARLTMGRLVTYELASCFS